VSLPPGRYWAGLLVGSVLFVDRHPGSSGLAVRAAVPLGGLAVVGVLLDGHDVATVAYVRRLRF
jgi:hypothetical protein